MTKQRNCHARSKKKRKLLRLKNFFDKVIRNRMEKKRKSLEPKGTTITGKALPHAIEVTKKSFYDHEFEMKLNQRQKRKRRRQQPHGRKKNK